MSKFDAVKENNTDGINCDVSTEDILAKLEKWDSEYGIEISDVTHNTITVRFNSLPENLENLAKEIHVFCPDVIDQNFGVMDEMLEMFEESGREPPPVIAELIKGVDFEDENFGQILLQKSLRTSNLLGLWWD